MSGEGGAIAEVLAAHRGCFRLQRRGELLEFDCGIEVPLNSPSPEAAHLAEAASLALADLLAAERQRGREEALREAAREAEERGDIGKDGGCEAWTWLRIRADRIAKTP